MGIHHNASVFSFPSQDEMYLIDHGGAANFYSETAETRFCSPQASRRLRRGGASGLFFLRILAVLLGLLIMASFCTRDRPEALEPGMRDRRLAGDDDDDFELPSSPALEQLCASIGVWVPAESSPQDPRSSPQMVEGFFSEMESTEEPVVAPPGYETHDSFRTEVASSGFPPKRPGMPDEESVDEEPGPSWRRSKRARVAQAAPPAPPVAPSAPTPVSSAAFSLQQEPGAPSLDPVQFFALPVKLLILPSTPRSSSAAAAAVHPFIRIPPLDAGVIPRPWVSPSELVSLPSFQPRQTLMSQIRELLLQPSLNAVAVRQLMKATERLAAYAPSGFKPINAQQQPADAVRNWGRRFMLLNVIHSAARAVGGPLPPWWGEVVNVVVGDSVFQLAARDRSESFNKLLAQLLSAALLKYKNGSAPTDDEVLAIKRMLICHAESPSVFRRPEWDLWRADDAQWER